MEGHIFIVAGLYVSSTILFYLLHHPHELQRLETKISGALDHTDGIRMGSALQLCGCLSSCIDETPQNVSGHRRATAREALSGGLDIPALGLQVPAGVCVGVPVYAIQHRNGFVTELIAFERDRWLASSPDD